MTSGQRAAALALLRASLSEKGFATAETIRRLEDVLREIEGSTMRDPERYFLAVFGEPSEAGAWGRRWEAHAGPVDSTILRSSLSGSSAMPATNFLEGFGTVTVVVGVAPSRFTVTSNVVPSTYVSRTTSGKT